MPAAAPIAESQVPELKLLHRGKVRDVYEIDADRVLLVATDRISAFDCILPTLIPRKGEVLTQLSAFWFGKTREITRNHLITANFDEMPADVRRHEELRGRSMLCWKADVFRVECVVRGYLEGSGWKDYKEKGGVCGHDLPRGLVQCDRLQDPIFTPSTKAVEGHDQNISQIEFSKLVGKENAGELKRRTLAIYDFARAYAKERGIIIADTKFEFGLDKYGRIMLVDEILTPDSSRFWARDAYDPGHAQPSFDKQFVREYLETLDWDKQPPAPPLPDEVCLATSQRYLEAYRLLTGKGLDD
jgi:phosphoribosylaminoimidazole-succinocarboxamide synthase